MKTKSFLLLAFLSPALFAVPKVAQAHCDSLDGPVIQTAKAALADGNVNPVLKWVRADDEAAIRAAFAETREVRKVAPAATVLADRYFFETLVRLHRAGEGEPFTGLKPAGSAEPAIVAADQALDKGSMAGLVDNLQQRIAAGLRQRFDKVLAAKPHAEHNLEAGRAYVEAYVDFIHYYESLHETAARSAADKPAGHVH